MTTAMKTNRPGTHDGNKAEAVEVTRRGPSEAEAWRPTFTPPIDIHEVEDGLILEADLPGVTQENLTIRLEDNVLVIDGRIENTVPSGMRPVYEEYRLGDYHRSFILSDEVDRSRISADLHAGVLRLVLPKAERAKTRRIAVKTSAGSEGTKAQVHTSGRSTTDRTAERISS